MNMIAIIGSGFGLYGYLPAVIRVYGRALLSNSSLSVIASRSDLEWCIPFIEWKESDISALESATKAVIAVPPASQPDIANRVFQMPNITHLLLEKPVSPHPSDARKLLLRSIEAKKQVRVGYTFLYTDWYKLLRESITPSTKSVEIQWSFCAYHFSSKKDTWKRYHSLGGGALRFYGIHLIAVLALLGFKDPVFSKLEYDRPDQPIAWHACFESLQATKCTVFISIASRHTKFTVSTTDDDKHINQVYYAESPFDRIKDSCNEDSRVPVLVRLLKTFADSSFQYEDEYEVIHCLWERIENMQCTQ